MVIMKIKTIAELGSLLKTAFESYSSVGIITHKNPDGDGIGSALAMQEILNARNIKADIILERELSPLYDFLSGQERTVILTDDLKFDLLIILDCHEIDRIGECFQLISKAKQVIIIDHHLENKLIEPSLSFISYEYASVGAIVYLTFKNEIKDLPDRSRKFIADSIYTTILNDSDNFLNANTDGLTFSICSKLMRYDLIPGQITETFLLSESAEQMRFVGEALTTIETFEQGKILFFHSTLDMLKRNNLRSEANDKMTRWVKGTKNVRVVVYFQELERHKYRLSFRSNFLNVNMIAVKFEGGGHKRASGCRMFGSLEEIKVIILDEIQNSLKKPNFKL